LLPELSGTSDGNPSVLRFSSAGLDLTCNGVWHFGQVTVFPANDVVDRRMVPQGHRS